MILLIGATSFLGPSVIEKLLDSGQDIKCLIRTGSSCKVNEALSKETKGKVSFTHGNLLSPDSMMDALSGVSSIVYMVDLVKTDLLENFLSAVSRTNIKRVLFISSTTVLLPIDIDAKEKKLQSEKLIRKPGLHYTILRPTMIYGVSDDPNFSKMLKFIKKRGFFITFGSGKNLIQPVYIGDVSQAVADIIDNAKTHEKTYEIAGKKPMKYNDMLEIVRNSYGMDFKVLRFPIGPAKFFISLLGGLSRRLSLTPGQVERMRIDKTYSYKDAEEDFDFSPIPFEEGIKRLINNMKDLS